MSGVCCPLCGGEGVVGGLIVGDVVVDERCGRCGGTGAVEADEPRRDAKADRS